MLNKSKLQKLLRLLFAAVLAAPLFSLAFISSPANAYKCLGETAGTRHVYEDGACYLPAGALDGDEGTSDDEGSQNEDDDSSQATRVDGELPVHNDGSPIDEWECPNGDTYVASSHSCQTCNAFGGECESNPDVSPVPAGADETIDPEDPDGDGIPGRSDEEFNSALDDSTGGEGECAGEKTDFFACGADGSDAIVSIVKFFIIIMTVGVGFVAVGGLVYGGVLYAAAQDNEEQVRRSIKIMRNVVIGVVLYVFMAAIINYIVPGGVFEFPEEECVPAEIEESGDGDETVDENGGSGNEDETDNQNEDEDQNNNNSDAGDEENQDENDDSKPPICDPESDTESGSEEEDEDGGNWLSNLFG